MKWNPQSFDVDGRHRSHGNIVFTLKLMAVIAFITGLFFIVESNNHSARSEIPTHIAESTYKWERITDSSYSTRHVRETVYRIKDDYAICYRRERGTSIACVPRSVGNLPKLTD